MSKNSKQKIVVGNDQSFPIRGMSLFQGCLLRYHAKEVFISGVDVRKAGFHSIYLCSCIPGNFVIYVVSMKLTVNVKLSATH